MTLSPQAPRPILSLNKRPAASTGHVIAALAPAQLATVITALESAIECASAGNLTGAIYRATRAAAVLKQAARAALTGGAA